MHYSAEFLNQLSRMYERLETCIMFGS